MADRMSWWVIPGALVVLARVATLVGGDPEAPGRATARDADTTLDPVVLQDASGKRSKPVSWCALTTNALVLEAPAVRSGEQATVTLRRRGDVDPDASVITFTANVRDDGTIAVGGLAAGQYDVRAVFARDGASWSACDVAAPGEHALEAAAPAPVR